MAQQHQLSREGTELLETWDAAWKEKSLPEVTESSWWPFANADKSVGLSPVSSTCASLAVPGGSNARVLYTVKKFSCGTSSELRKMYPCQANSEKNQSVQAQGHEQQAYSAAHSKHQGGKQHYLTILNGSSRDVRIAADQNIT